jgi:hypothetical protein
MSHEGRKLKNMIFRRSVMVNILPKLFFVAGLYMLSITPIFSRGSYSRCSYDFRNDISKSYKKTCLGEIYQNHIISLYIQNVRTLLIVNSFIAYIAWDLLTNLETFSTLIDFQKKCYGKYTTKAVLCCWFIYTKYHTNC